MSGPSKNRSESDIPLHPFLLTLWMTDLCLAVYGIEGKLDSRYLGATRSVLQSIAKVTEELNGSFDLYGHGPTSGISRISAHLHLLEHQVSVPPMLLFYIPPEILMPLS